MTLADLRRLAESLPPGASLTLPREALLELTNGTAPAGVPPAESQNGGASPPSRWLTAQDVAIRLETSVRWVYANARQWPFTRRTGRLVRFDAEGFERWMARTED